MTSEEGIDYALSEEQPTPPASPMSEEPLDGEQSGALTRRENEVAVLVARGLTNRQVASELVISERTVDNHVASILKKLNVRSREQVAFRLHERHPHHRSDPS